MLCDANSAPKLVSSTQLTMISNRTRIHSIRAWSKLSNYIRIKYHIISTDLSHGSDSAYYVNYKKTLLVGLDDKFYQQKKECSLKCIFKHTLKGINKGHIKNGERSFYKNHKLISFINSDHKSGESSGMFRQCHILSAKRGQVELSRSSSLFSKSRDKLQINSVHRSSLETAERK